VNILGAVPLFKPAAFRGQIVVLEISTDYCLEPDSIEMLKNTLIAHFIYIISRIWELHRLINV
jgi:hypothetical protein